jgi:hypothetical protein
VSEPFVYHLRLRHIVRGPNLGIPDAAVHRDFELPFRPFDGLRLYLTKRGEPDRVFRVDGELTWHITGRRFEVETVEVATRGRLPHEVILERVAQGWWPGGAY